MTLYEALVRRTVILYRNPSVQESGPMSANLALQDALAASSLLLGIVLVSAGWPKAIASAGFAVQIEAYGMVPKSAAPLIARVISSGELLAGILLIAGLGAPEPLRRIGAAISALLFLTFLVALVSAQARGRHIACACFGGNGELETVGSHSIVRTALLLILAFAAILPAHGEHPLEVLGLTAVLASLVAVLSELARLLGPLRRACRSILEELTATSGLSDEHGVH